MIRRFFPFCLFSERLVFEWMLEIVSQVIQNWGFLFGKIFKLLIQFLYQLNIYTDFLFLLESALKISLFRNVSISSNLSHLLLIISTQNLFNFCKVISFLFFILAICALFLFFLSLAKDMSLLLTFSKTHPLISLLSLIFYMSLISL